MGKPIAGQNQFPFVRGGFLVDAAKINGSTYIKKLYIYKQRSYGMYDLQDEDGTIFRFIKLVHQDKKQNNLNYFDSNENLVSEIPDNTFFIKIQDPSRSIYSFVRLYQLNKCITSDGDYVFMPLINDELLSGVSISPSTSIIYVDQLRDYNSTFVPWDYPNTEGSWNLSTLSGDEVIDISTIASIESTSGNSAKVKGLSVGKASLTFVPEDNNSVSAQTIINVITDSSEIQSFYAVPKGDYGNFVIFGNTMVYEIVTYPYDAVISEPLKVVQENNSTNAKVKLIDVSSDNKTYTFSTELINPEEGYYICNPQMRFLMTDPLYHSVTVGGVSVITQAAYTELYRYGTSFQFPQLLRPNMTYKVRKGMYLHDNEIFPYISSDPEIATFDPTTSTITTGSKLGEVTFDTKYRDANGVVRDLPKFKKMKIQNEVWDYITLSIENNATYVTPGSTTKLTLNGYKDGIPEQINFKTGVFEFYHNITPDGVLTVSPRASDSYRMDIIGDFNSNQVLGLYNANKLLSLYCQEPGTSIPMTAIYTHPAYETIYLRYTPDFDTYVSYNTFLLGTYCNEYAQEVIYDNTLIELRDADRVLDGLTLYAGRLSIEFKGLRRGSGKIIIRSVQNPSVEKVIRVVVY